MEFFLHIHKKKREGERERAIDNLSSATYSVDILLLYSDNGDAELPKLTVDNMDKWVSFFSLLIRANPLRFCIFPEMPFFVYTTVTRTKLKRTW